MTIRLKFALVIYQEDMRGIAGETQSLELDSAPCCCIWWQGEDP